MGLLDELAGQVLGGGGAATGASAVNTAGVAEAVLGMLHNHGGIGGLAQVFQQKGLGDLMNHWISTGPNPAMTPDQAHSVFGTAQISAIAQKLGINPQMAAGAIAAMLPTIIDHLTPNGTIPTPQTQQASGGSLLEQGLGMLRNSGLLG
ncbi:MAG: YidB family protein [Acidobacteriota bacterium]